ncbi:MAG: hypothetical protein OEW66_10320 [Actinomycetota bacterium]|nr:hypothetical protein [Actinomycetota bacterium]
MALVLVAAACSSGSVGQQPAPDATETPIAQTGGGAGSDGNGGTNGSNAGSTAEVLGFSAPRLGGGTIEGQDFSGRDVAFWFWAPW